MPRYIKSVTEVVTEESASNGDVDRYEDEGHHEVTGVADAIRFLKENGVIEASSSQFIKGVWYNSESQMDMHTGEWSSTSFFLKGFSEHQESEIFETITR